MLRFLVCVGAGVLLFAGAAHAACPSPFPAKDGAGNTQSLAAINDTSSNCVFPSAITDGNGAANRAAVKGPNTAPTAGDDALVVTVSPNSGGFGCLGQSVANTHSTPISITANAQIIPGGATGTQTYICTINISVAGTVGTTESVALVEGTGTACNTGTTGMAGGATAATGWNFAANGGLTLGSGVGLVARTATAVDNVCLLVSGSAQVSGTIVWAQF